MGRHKCCLSLAVDKVDAGFLFEEVCLLRRCGQRRNGLLSSVVSFPAARSIQVNADAVSHGWYILDFSHLVRCWNFLEGRRALLQRCCGSVRACQGEAAESGAVGTVRMHEDPCLPPWPCHHVVGYFGP